MKGTNSARRRALLAALGWAAIAPSGGALAQGSASVEGGVPHRLPLASVDDLGISQPAQVEGEAADLGVLTLGVIDVPSGRLEAVDAMLLEGAPFVPSVQPGRYPLQIVLARLAGGTERVAFAQVKLADRPAQTWINAVIEGEDPAELQDGEISVFAVESGVAALFDAAALTLWRAELSHNEGLVRELEQVLRQNRRPVWTWARVRAGGGSGYLFTAGLGEGEYGAYWGKDRAGTTVSLVLDFDLLEWAGLPQQPAVMT